MTQPSRTDADTGQPVSLDVFDGEQRVRHAVFRQPSVTIGRVDKADLHLEDPSLSRMHAVIEVHDAAGGMVIDLGSASGVLLNGQHVRKARLQTGDVLTLGRFRVVLAFGPDVGDALEVQPVPPSVGGIHAPPAEPPLPHAPAATGVAEPELRERVGLCVVKPGTALVVRSRRSGEIRAVRTSGHVMAWPGFATATEIDLTPFTVHAHAHGEGAAVTADGLRVDVTLRLTLRPHCDDAEALEMVRMFGVPPRSAQRARALADALTPTLAALLSSVTLGQLRTLTELRAGRRAGLGFDLDRVEVLHVGDGEFSPTGTYRGSELDVTGVRFEGVPVATAPGAAAPPSPQPRPAKPIPALTWAEADTGQRVILGMFILGGGYPAAAFTVAVSQLGVALVTELVVLLVLLALTNVLATLRSWWTAPPAVWALGTYFTACHSSLAPGSTDIATSVGNLTMTPSLHTVPFGLWIAAVLFFGRNPPEARRPP